MKKNNLIAKLGIFFSVLMLSAATIFAQSRTEEWFVADKMVDCQGVAPQKCLVVREVNSADWKYFYGTIKGFKFRENFTQKIRVSITPRKNVPADASQFEYKLVKTISRSKTDGNTLEEAMRQMQNQKSLTVGGKWIITEIEDMKVEAGKATMEFDEKERRFGAKICNGMGGNYEINGANIKFSKMMGTMMFCGEPLQPIEDKFKAVMEKITRGERSGNVLVFFAGDKPVLKLAAEGNLGINKPLEGTKWAVIEIEGAQINPKGEIPYLQLDRENKAFSGSSGCNRVSGKYELDGENLKFGRALMTRRACVDQNSQKIEMGMTQALEKINRFEIKNGVLSLYEGDKVLLKLMPLAR